MYDGTVISKTRLVVLLVVLVLSAAAAVPAARADVIWTGGGAGIRQEVNLVDANNGVLTYLLNGNRTSTPLADVRQIQIDGEKAFNDAEAAYAAGDYKKAAADYLPVVRRRADDWVRLRAARRLLDAANRAGSLPGAAAGYVQLARLDPAAAVGNEPALAGAAPVDLEVASREVESALSARLAPAQEKTLLVYLLNLQNARGDEAAAGKTVDRLGRLVGGDPNEDPRLLAQIFLARAKLALKNNQPADAAAFVNDHAALFADPRQQSEALMVLAQAAEKRAGDDEGKLLDTAFAYMKVVAYFKAVPDAPNVADALLRVADIHARLGKTEAAAKLYAQVVEQYPASPAADAARRKQRK